jgi:hypothetical protein
MSPKTAQEGSAVEHGVKFMAELVLHALSRSRSFEDRVLFALKTLCCQFQIHLRGAGGYGQVSSARTERILDLFKEIHCRNVQPRIDDGGFERQVGRIWQFSVASINCGHLMSMVDIVLGSFRFCANRPDAQASKTMFAQLLPLLPAKPTGENFKDNTGLLLRPGRVQVPDFRGKYSQLGRDIVGLATSVARASGVEEDEVPL